MGTFVKGDLVSSSGRRATVVAADGDTAWLRTSSGDNIFVLVSTLVPEKPIGEDMRDAEPADADAAMGVNRALQI
jgi:hypothetical protein